MVEIVIVIVIEIVIGMWGEPDGDAAELECGANLTASRWDVKKWKSPGDSNGYHHGLIKNTAGVGQVKIIIKLLEQNHQGTVRLCLYRNHQGNTVVIFDFGNDTTR